ncbi:hypothetical protein F3Y22_tig00111741pilonHSYRG00313 [Hibiscus syriacus]|uniref:RNase H type-1 domain-containing protein n=1 Tax=Hibiscus syriacus TaxID=106335 RepID=A0A6A2XGR2_HIBSY|nr:hypothetical protein F3Y22_tig00111741pilonHSYRG00313 [Hibiscus syriacus]
MGPDESNDKSETTFTVSSTKPSIFTNFVEYEDILVQCVRLENDIVAIEAVGLRQNGVVRAAELSCRSSMNWIKANTDGAFGGLMKMVVAGGVLRDDQGVWIFGFARSLGICTVFMVEFWAIHDSLSHAWHFGFRGIKVETDCAKAVETLNNNIKAVVGGAIVSLIWELLQRDLEIRIKHVHREANLVAERLAALARGNTIGTVLYHSPPSGIVALLVTDNNT